MTVYGHFHGGDTREFSPDPECSTEAERALHREHCAAWDRGEVTEVPVSGWIDENTHVTRSAYGLGTYTVDFDEDEDGVDPETAPLTDNQTPVEAKSDGANEKEVSHE